MSIGKRSWAVGLLVSAAATLGATAHATPNGKSPLPLGVHLRSDGHYVEELCGAGFHSHCEGVRLLSDDYVPPAVPRAVPQATFCGSGGGGGSTKVPTTSMAPKDALAAYNIPATSAAGGKIVALIDMPDTKAFTDLNAYRKAFSIPALPECATIPHGTPATPCFAAVDEMGTTLNPTVTDCPLGDGETGLDMDMVSAVCPDCSILLVQMTDSDATLGPDNDDYANAVATAARLGAVSASISFGDHEATDPLLGDAGAPHDRIGYTTPGTTVFVAAGDFGYDNETINVVESGVGKSPSYPASAPDVIAVGGTNLVSGTSGYSENVWNNKSDGQDITTSGCSTEFAAPSWQASVLTGTGCAMRATADLAAAATFTSGTSQTSIAAYASGGWERVEGTSASSPLVAALFTRLGLATGLSTNLGFPYANMSAFNDVTVGTDDIDNENCGKLCNAGTGWDGPTGVGTPNGAKLLALAGALDGGVPPVADAGSGASDGGVVGDAGGEPVSGDDDSGTPIAINDDAGSLGGGSDVDAGGGLSTVDAGPVEVAPGPGGSTSSGCGCAFAGDALASNGLAAWALGIGWILAARRRRRA